MTPLTSDSRVCPMKLHLARRLFDNTFAGFSARKAAVMSHSRNHGVIHLDSWREVADTNCNIPAASLLELVPCHFSDVLKRLVLSEQIARFELQRITAAPPLVISNGQHANIGRLLFCLFKTPSNALTCGGKLDQRRSLRFWEAAI